MRVIVVAHLRGHFVFGRCLGKQADLPGSTGQRLFAVHVFAVLHAIESHGRVCMVRGGDNVVPPTQNRVSLTVQRQFGCADCAPNMVGHVIPKKMLDPIA
jgi:hypothetical protein